MVSMRRTIVAPVAPGVISIRCGNKYMVYKLRGAGVRTTSWPLALREGDLVRRDGSKVR